MIPNRENDWAPRTVILDFLQDSLLEYLVRGRKFFDDEKERERALWVEIRPFRW